MGALFVFSGASCPAGLEPGPSTILRVTVSGRYSPSFRGVRANWTRGPGSGCRSPGPRHWTGRAAPREPLEPFPFPQSRRAPRRGSLSRQELPVKRSRNKHYCCRMPRTLSCTNCDGGDEEGLYFLQKSNGINYSRSLRSAASSFTAGRGRSATASLPAPCPQ